MNQNLAHIFVKTDPHIKKEIDSTISYGQTTVRVACAMLMNLLYLSHGRSPCRPHNLSGIGCGYR